MVRQRSHLPLVEGELQITGSSPGGLQHLSGPVDADDLPASSRQLDRVPARSAGDVQEPAASPSRPLPRNEFIDERGFGRVRLVAIEDVVELGIGALVDGHAAAADRTAVATWRTCASDKY